MFNNLVIRDFAKAKGVRMWEIAHRWGCDDATFSRKMRFEFSPEDQEKALKIISEIVEERMNEFERK